MSLIEPLTTAIYNKLTGNAAFNTAMGGRIFYEEYKTTDGSLPATYPFAIFFYVSDIPDLTFNTLREDVLFQVSIFDNASSAVNMLDYTTKLRAVLDFDPSSPPTLSITGWTLYYITRESGEIMTPDENSIRHSVSTYRVKAQKN